MVNPGAGTGVEDAKASIRAGSLMNIEALNAALKIKFDTDVNNWHLNMLSGQPIPEDRRKPPVPPMKWELGKPDRDGYEWPVQGNTPIAPVPEAVFYHGITRAQQVAELQADVTDIGIEFADGEFQSGPLDTRPTGYRVKLTKPDGTVITLQKMRTPFGARYEQVG